MFFGDATRTYAYDAYALKSPVQANPWSSSHGALDASQPLAPAAEGAPAEAPLATNLASEGTPKLRLILLQASAESTWYWKHLGEEEP